MLKGDRVVLRALQRSEVAAVASWDVDPATWRLASNSPYVPRTVADAEKGYDDGTLFRSDDRAVFFVVDVGGEPVGSIVLWGIDRHNRRAHLGITMAPEWRNRGYGQDAIVVLLRYAFRDRGLHRVQLEVLADHEAALAAYRKAGFVVEGVARDDGWVDGGFADQVIMSVLSTDPGRHRDPS